MSVEEGVDIVVMAVSTTFACIFLSLFIQLFNYNHDVQSAFERESIEQELNQAYSRVVAYDNSTINGQDVLSFLTRYKGKIPVIVRKGSSTASISEYTITNNTAELEQLRNAGGGSWPYHIYQFNSDISDTDDLVKASTAHEVYQNTDLVNYTTGAPGATPTADLTAQQIIDQYSDFIKTYRKDALGREDGLYGDWYSVVYYKDISCREPECIEVYPVD